MEYRISIIILFLIVSGCTEDPCLKSSGDRISYSVDIPAFQKIELNDAIELELVYRETPGVQVTTRENLKDFLSISVVENVLVIKDHNTCNWLREYNQTKVTVFHPDITAIDHFGSGKVYSKDTLFYRDMRLYCKNAPGDFDLVINSNKVVVSVDDLNNITLSGKCNEIFIGIYAGDGRIDASNLIANTAGFFQRGSNDILFYPVDLLHGEIIGYGNVIYGNYPSVIQVKDSGRGELINATK